MLRCYKYGSILLDIYYAVRYIYISLIIARAYYYMEVRSNENMLSPMDRQ